MQQNNPGCRENDFFFQQRAKKKKKRTYSLKETGERPIMQM